MGRNRLRKKRRRPSLVATAILGVVAMLIGVGLAVWLGRSSADESPKAAQAEAVEADILLPTYDAPAKTLAEVVQRYVDAQGGDDAVKNINSIRLSGRFISPSGEASFDQLRKQPNRFSMSFEIDGRKVRTTTDGESVWREVEGNPNAYRLPEAEARSFLASAPILEHLWLRRNEPDALRLLDSQSLDGRPYHRIRVSLDDGTELIYWIDQETYIGHRTDYRYPNGRQQTIRYSEFDRIGPLYAPHRIEIESPDGTNTIIIERSELNVGVLSAYFQAPEKLEPWPEDAN